MNTRDWYRRALQQGQPPRPPYTPQPQTGPTPDPQPQREGIAPIPTEQWHASSNIGRVYTADAVRQWKGSAGAQTSAIPCPQCGAPDGFLSVIPAASEGAVGVQSNVRLSRDSARGGHCFYCGYRESGRGPTTGLGLPGATSTGRPRDAHGALGDPYDRSFSSTARGNEMRVDRSLVGRGAA